MARHTWLVLRLCACVCACACPFVACATGTLLEGDAGLDGSPAPEGGPGADSSTCSPPLVHCTGTAAGVCTDLKTSADHCGTCTTVCGTADAGALEAGSGNPDSGIPPIDGGITPTGPFWSTGSASCEGGACAVDCPPGMTVCSDGICYDPQNFHDHCGDCNTACAPTEYCAAGHCCGQGKAWCGSSCIDVLSDSNNCGSCGHACAAPLTCVSGACAYTVEIFPPTGTLYDPGSASVWSARYYTMTFATSQTILGLTWRVNLAMTDYIYSEIWDPNNTTTPLAKGTPIYGAGTEQFYNSPINFTVTAGKAYLVGAYLSNANSVFPRKDSPTYPFTVTDQLGNITVSACWSTSTTNTDIFPTSTNYWGPDFKLSLQ